jgi:hypothetical protein
VGNKQCSFVYSKKPYPYAPRAQLSSNVFSAAQNSQLLNLHSFSDFASVTVDESVPTLYGKIRALVNTNRESESVRALSKIRRRYAVAH